MRRYLGQGIVEEIQIRIYMRVDRGRGFIEKEMGKKYKENQRIIVF